MSLGSHGEGSPLGAVEAPPVERAESEEPSRASWRVRDVVFVAVFTAYAAGALVALGLGIGAAVASRACTVAAADTSTCPATDIHTNWHDEELDADFMARPYERTAKAAHDVGPLGGVFFDYTFSFLLFGLAIFLLWLRPRDRSARLLALALVGTAGSFNLTAQIAVESVPPTGLEDFAQTAAHSIAGMSYLFAVLFFPDGRPVPRWRWQVLAPMYAVIIVGAIAFAARIEGTRRPSALLFFFGLAVPIVGAAAQAYRFERAENPTEHAQARLMFWALVPALGVGVWFLITQGWGSLTEPVLQGRHLPDQPVLVFRIFQPVFLLVPVALVLGLLRYRLWDIDRVVNRTLVYGLATGLVGGLTVGFVLLLQQLFDPFTAGNDLAVAISTLLFVAVFVPVRRRIQDFVDRRFYRHRYDAQRTIEAFSARLRDQLDLESLGHELRGVASRTMQPRHVTLLLRGEEGRMDWQWTYRGQPRDQSRDQGP